VTDKNIPLVREVPGFVDRDGKIHATAYAAKAASCQSLFNEAVAESTANERFLKEDFIELLKSRPDMLDAITFLVNKT
jgi:hypothetical protein